MTTEMLKSLKPRGFSLIEMLVYISVLVFMLAIIMEVVISVTGSERVIKTTRNIENSAVSAIELIGREVRQAESISASSILETHPGHLILSGTDDVGAPRTVEFYLSSGRVWLTENGAAVGALTGTESTVTNLVFHRFASTTTEGIRTEMTIESGTSTHYRSENFYSSSILR